MRHTNGSDTGGIKNKSRLLKRLLIFRLLVSFMPSICIICPAISIMPDFMGATTAATTVVTTMARRVMTASVIRVTNDNIITRNDFFIIT